MMRAIAEGRAAMAAGDETAQKNSIESLGQAQAIPMALDKHRLDDAPL